MNEGKDAKRVRLCEAFFATSLADAHTPPVSFTQHCGKTHPSFFRVGQTPLHIATMWGSVEAAKVHPCEALCDSSPLPR